MADKCCKPVQCMTVPNAKIECSCDATFRLNERFLFDAVAMEHPSATATEVEFYPLNKAKSSADPLYGEMISHGWDGPFKIKGIVTEVIVAPEARDVGTREMRTPKVWIARRELELVGARNPHLGDIIRIWKLPYWDRVNTKTPPDPIDGFFFNIQTIQEAGFLFDSGYFVGFDCGLTRATEFVPERRVYDR